MKNISIVWKRIRHMSPRMTPTDAQWTAWLRDPLSHPAIDSMVERELADLPFNRGPFGPATTTPGRRQHA